MKRRTRPAASVRVCSPFAFTTAPGTGSRVHPSITVYVTSPGGGGGGGGDGGGAGGGVLNVVGPAGPRVVSEPPHAVAHATSTQPTR